MKCTVSEPGSGFVILSLHKNKKMIILLQVL